jgi:DNA-binding transcriptional ArsR family regulator
MEKSSFDQVAEILKILGHPTRLINLNSLMNKDCCVNTLGKLLNIRQSRVSQHLALLKVKGIIIDKRCGSTVSYSLKDKRIGELIKLFQNI